jgi:carbon-monoxide dehydrogenase medium subunit
MLPPFEYYQPQTLAEALELMAVLPEPKKALAGGTDVIPALRRGELTPGHLVALGGLAELKQIQTQNGEVRIGPLVTFSELARSPLVGRCCRLLAEAAAAVGGPQIRNQGTIGGNVVNASPAGDLLPPLVALEAGVELRRKGGERTLPLAEFLVGSGKTLLSAGEILTGISFPPLPAEAASSFVKLGRRNSLAISRLSAAVIIFPAPGGRIAGARLALGAVAPKPVRVPAAEALLCGNYPGPELLEEVAGAAANFVRDILGSRPSAPYKRVAVRSVVREALLKAVPAFGQKGGRAQ